MFTNSHRRPEVYLARIRFRLQQIREGEERCETLVLHLATIQTHDYDFLNFEHTPCHELIEFFNEVLAPTLGEVSRFGVALTSCLLEKRSCLTTTLHQRAGKANGDGEGGG